jgi:hypothetical protein
VLIIVGRGPPILRHANRRHPGAYFAALCDHEAEMFLHRTEIPVVVQQRVAVLDTESANDEIGRFADRHAQFFSSR